MNIQKQNKGVFKSKAKAFSFGIYKKVTKDKSKTCQRERENVIEHIVRLFQKKGYPISKEKPGNFE